MTIPVPKTPPIERRAALVEVLLSNGRVLRVAEDKVIHAIVDDYVTFKYPKVLKWLGNHPRRVFHFTPTLAGSGA